MHHTPGLCIFNRKGPVWLQVFIPTKQEPRVKVNSTGPLHIRSYNPVTRFYNRAIRDLPVTTEMELNIDLGPAVSGENTVP